MREFVASAGVIATISLGLCAVLAFTFGVGCAGIGARATGYAYFDEPARDDAWSPKIAGWQRRENRQQPASLEAVSNPSDEFPGAAPVAVPGSDEAAGSTVSARDLRSKYEAFRAERKRGMARDVAQWIQAQAKIHYVDDGPVDHWATLEETLQSDGDDCDGLELLTFHALRDLGFDDNEIYRAIVYRPSDGQHHMVTLWFERSDDPWVIDPTGAMTKGMPRMSEMPAWVPIKVFSDHEEFTVHPAPLDPASDRRAVSHRPAAATLGSSLALGDRSR